MPRSARGNGNCFLKCIAAGAAYVTLIALPAHAADAPAPAAAASSVLSSSEAGTAANAAAMAAAASSAPSATAAASAAAPSPSAASSAASAPAAAASGPRVQMTPVITLIGPEPAASAVPPPARKVSNKVERVQVNDPYIELRTGPGRGFPIFFVAPRNEWIEIELRHTDWFRVRTDDGKVGWVVRQQLETTLTAAGGRKSFRDVLLDDYLTRNVQLGVSWGHFKSEPILKLWTNVRVSDTLSLEGTLGQVQGVFSGTNLWHVNLLVEPWSDKRISPFFGVGFGKFKNFPNLSLIGATTTDAKLANAVLGVRYHLSERFVLSADYSLYTAFVSDQRSTEYRAWTGGLSFFF